MWFDATFDFSNPRFFEPSSISLGGSKNRNSTVFWNQNLSVLIDGLHNERKNLCLDVCIIYSFQMTIHWETEYCIYCGDKSNRTSHTFLFVTRYYFAMHFNFHVKLKFDVLYTRCTPNTNNVFVNRARRSVWPEFDLFDDVLSSIIPPGDNQLSTMYHTSMYNIYKAFTQEETQFVDLIGVED